MRLLAVAMIQPYRTKQKNDQNDAAARCEAVSRPRTRFVPVKSEGQQAVLTGQRARELRVSERTALANQIRGVVMEYGIVGAPGLQRLRRALPEVLARVESLPTLGREVVDALRARWLELEPRIGEYGSAAPTAGQADCSHASVDAGRGGGPHQGDGGGGHDWPRAGL